MQGKPGSLVKLLGYFAVVPPYQPLDALTRFATALGWPELRLHQHTIDDAAFAHDASVLTWYESGEASGLRSDFFLQINEAPSGQTTTYAAAVYAMRYRICTGWHSFTLRETADELMAEALRVETWLHRKWFDTLVMRRQFRQLHPECSNYSWARIQTDGPPYALH